MTDDEIDKFRASERQRMAPMREAARKEAFVQGYLRGKYGDLSKQTDEALLEMLPEADAAYTVFIVHRSRA
jgi:hypothetical protein